MLVQARVLVGCTTTSATQRAHTSTPELRVGQPAPAVQPELVQLHLGSSPKPVSLLAAQSPPRYAGEHPTCRAPPQVPAHTSLKNPPDSAGMRTWLNHSLPTVTMSRGSAFSVPLLVVSRTSSSWQRAS